MSLPKNPTGFLPTIDDLSAAPQLSALAMLDAALNFATDALFAAHPQLYYVSCARTPEKRRGEPTEVWLGDLAIAQATHLRHTLARYRQALHLPPPIPDDDINF